MKIPFSRTVKRTAQEGLKKTISTILGITAFYALSPSILKRTIQHAIYGHFFENIIREVNGLKMILSLKDKGICRDLYLWGKREPVSTDYLMTSGILKEGDVVLDIGANIGYYALLESKLVGSSGKVYAVEPVSTNIDLLMRNIKLNGFKNIEAFRLAIGDKNGRSKIYLSDCCNICAMKKGQMNVIGEEEVEVVTVDSFLEGRDIPNLIRMDVEGYECNVIKGMAETLKRDVKLLMEVHGFLMTRKQLVEMFELLGRNDFKVMFVLVEPKHYVTVVEHACMHAIDRSIVNSPLMLKMDMKKLQEFLIKHRICPHVLFSKQKQKQDEDRL